MGLVGDEITSLGTNLSGSEDRIFTLGSNVHRYASFDMPETQYVADFPGYKLYKPPWFCRCSWSFHCLKPFFVKSP